jgi:hypothetical protein
VEVVPRRFPAVTRRVKLLKNFVQAHAITLAQRERITDCEKLVHRGTPEVVHGRPSALTRRVTGENLRWASGEPQQGSRNAHLTRLDTRMSARLFTDGDRP